MLIGSSIVLLSGGLAALGLAMTRGKHKEVDCAQENNTRACCQLSPQNATNTSLDSSCLKKEDWYTPVLIAGSFLILFGMMTFWAIEFPCHPAAGGGK